MFSSVSTLHVLECLAGLGFGREQQWVGTFLEMLLEVSGDGLVGVATVVVQLTLRGVGDQ